MSSEHNEMWNGTPRITNDDDEVSKKERQSDTKRVVNLVSVLSIAAALGGFGYVAYGGDKGEAGLRSVRLTTIGAMSAAWFLS